MKRLAMPFAAVLALALAAPAFAQADDGDVQQQLEQMRRQMDQLKQSVDTAVDRARDDRADDEADIDPDILARLEQLARQQRRLERQLDQLIDAQRRVEQDVRAGRGAAPADRGELNAPLDYRYGNARTQTTTTTTTRAARDDAAPPTDAAYTIYSNGYTSQQYVPPTRVARTAGPVVYSPTVHHVYYGGHSRIYRPYFHHGSRVIHRPHHRRAHLSVGVHTGNFFFRYGTGYHHHRSKHHW